MGYFNLDKTPKKPRKFKFSTVDVRTEAIKEQLRKTEAEAEEK